MALILCFAMVVPTTVSASEELPYWDKDITVDGNTVTLKITLRGPDRSCAGGQVDIYYPAEKLEYVCPEILEDGTEGYDETLGWLGIGNGTINGHTDPGVFKANFFSSRGVATNQVLCEVEFEITEGSTVTAADFTYEQVITDPNVNEITNLTPINFVCLHTNKTEVSRVDATCSAAGEVVEKCSSCGEETTTAIPATGNHTEGSWIVDKEATATEDGSKHTECTVCGTTIKTEVIPATGAEFNENLPYWEKNVTVDGDIVTFKVTLRGPDKSCAGGQVDLYYPADKLEYICPELLEDGTENYDEELGWLGIGNGSINGHTEDGVFIANFFSARGVKTNQILCEVQFRLTSGSTVTAADFTYSQILANSVGVEVFNPTAINFVCLHTNKTNIGSTPATCTEAGTSTDACLSCGEETTTETAALGHDEITTTTSATCTEAGSVTTSCSRCDYENVVETPALGHDLKTVTVNATCGANGSATTTCSRCDYSDVEVIPATGEHTASDWITDKEPTFEEEGSAHKECTVCGTVLETKVLDKVQSLYGDFDGDGLVAINDAVLISRYVNKIAEIPEGRFEFIDVNGDGRVNTGDAVLIARLLGKVIDKFPVEE